MLIVISCCNQDKDLNPIIPVSNGSLEQAKTFGGSKNDVAKSVIATSDGGFAVLGYTQSIDGSEHLGQLFPTSFLGWILSSDLIIICFKQKNPVVAPKTTFCEYFTVIFYVDF